MTGQLSVNTNLVALPESNVLVKNNRVVCRDQWENGIVELIDIQIISFNKSRVRYCVILDRKTKNGKVMRVYVPESYIKNK